MRNNKRRTLVTEILERVGRKMGVEVHIEPKWGYVGQVTLPDGRRRYFRNTNLDLNGLGAAEIARDKAYAEYFLKRMGYPVIKGEAFYTNRWSRVIKSRRNPQAAARYAKRIGWPVIVKPNSKSQGVGVCKVWNRRGLLRAVKELEHNERVFLVQRCVEGMDHRIVVLDGDVISAYQRFPLSVTGDGASSVRHLLQRKQREFERIGRDTVIKIDDGRIKEELTRHGLSFRTVPRKGERIELLPNANLSAGGDAADVTEQIHPAWRTLAGKIARDMNLRYIGIDVFTQEPLAERPNGYVIIEVNAAPGLDNYAHLGKAQQKIVEKLYSRVLLALTE